MELSTKEVQELKKQIKNNGCSLGTFAKLVRHLQSESQGVYNKCTERYEYHQSRVALYDEILELLPEASE